MDTKETKDLEGFSAFLREMTTILIECGCSSNRVESLCSRLGRMNQITVDVLAVPTGAWIMVQNEGRTLQTLTRVRRWQINLDKLSSINELVLAAESNLLDWRGLRERLQEIDRRKPPYSDKLTLIAGAGSSLGVNLLSGGTWQENVLAGLLGGGVFILAHIMRGESSRYLADFLSAFFATAAALFASTWNPEFDSQRVILSSIIVLLPGLSFVNAVHELAQKNLVSGSSKLFDSLIVGASLAFGVFVVQGLYSVVEDLVIKWNLF